ncbi:transposase [Actinoallomurus sp. NPDC052274]|uniref:DesA/ISL3 alpha bundle tail domain-containing protein n=1 Tax=Actinoallomurus sp. NPDC052274 TaxID=3155420 RepID=UPI00343AE7F9
MTGWILRHPDNLQPGERQQLEALTAASPALASVQEHVRGFAHMVPHLHGDQLERWMSPVESSDLPELRSFVTGLHRDLDAARAGLTLSYNSGKVEGHVTSRNPCQSPHCSTVDISQPRRSERWF